jgi:hypothetical protein
MLSLFFTRSVSALALSPSLFSISSEWQRGEERGIEAQAHSDAKGTTADSRERKREALASKSRRAVERIFLDVVFLGFFFTGLLFSEKGFENVGFGVFFFMFVVVGHCIIKSAQSEIEGGGEGQRAQGDKNVFFKCKKNSEPCFRCRRKTTPAPKAKHHPLPPCLPALLRLLSPFSTGSGLPGTSRRPRG